MNTNDKRPPGFLIQFFRWFCHADMVDYIEGDLWEVYDRRLKTSGKRKADWGFFIDVLLLFRPGIISPRKPFQNLTNYAMLKNYFKIGWRNLSRNKEYSLINVAGLAMSITCCLLIYALVKINFSTDNFHDSPDRIYRIVTEMKSNSSYHTSGVPTPLPGLIRENESFGEEIAQIYLANNVLITNRESDGLQFYREEEGVVFVQPEFFSIFNFPLISGSYKSLEETPNSVFLTKEKAQKYFGEGDPIGRSLLLDKEIELTVAGILQDFPPNTDFQSGIYVSYQSFKSYMPWLARENFWSGISGNMQCFVLLNKGFSAQDAEKSLASYADKYPISQDTKSTYSLQPLSDIHFNPVYTGSASKSSLWVLIAIGFFLLFTACLNFVNLATARALRRSKEVGLRKVMGGVRSQLFWQFIAETGIIVTLSIFLSLILSYSLIPFVNQWFGYNLDVTVYYNVEFFGFLGLLDLGITLLAGFYPAFIMGGFSPIQALKGKSSHLKVGGFNIRRSLIIAQFVISQVLVLALVVMMNQLKYATQSDLGFDKEAVVMVTIENDSLNFKQALKNEFLRIPGVVNVSLCESAPVSGSGWRTNIGLGQGAEESDLLTIIKMTDENYLETFGLELLEGRNLNPSDTVKELLVNETLLKNLGIADPQEAMGRIVTANGGNMEGEIVGVFKDFHDNSFHTEISPMLLTTDARSYGSFAIKLNVGAGVEPLREIEEVWKDNLPEQYFEYSFLDDSIARFYESETRMLKAIQIFSFIAIVIGCLGLYGLVSFMVAQKTKEIGIRKVLGGGVSNILWIFGKEFGRLILLAFLVASPIGWFLMKNWLQDFKFQVDLDWWLFIVTLATSAAITVISIGYHVIKAAFLNPANTLQTE